MGEDNKISAILPGKGVPGRRQSLPLELDRGKKVYKLFGRKEGGLPLESQR